MTVTDTRPAATDAAREDFDRILHVDPSTLIIGANARLDASLDRAFVASVKENGVREVVTAYYAKDGALTVLKGQRRTLAAVETGRPTIPVRVVAEPAKDTDRIVDQLIENERRAAMGVGETALAYEQLELGGLSAAAIARRTGTDKKAVYARITVARSELARRAADRYELDLVQAATLAEFDDDKETCKALIAAAKKGAPGQFEHLAQQARDRRALHQQHVTLAAELAADGVAVVDWPLSAPERALSALGITGDDADRHRATCEGHAAAIVERHQDGRTQCVVVPVCVDPVANGHAAAPAATAAPAEERRPMTEEEKAAKRLLIARNKEWDSAVTVRRDWIAALATRKTAPSGAEAFIASALLTWDAPLRNALENQHKTLAAILGETDAAAMRAKLADSADRGTAKRATLLALVVLLAAWEGRTSRDTWRRPTATDRAVMQSLVTWGYGPSEVEALILDEPETDDAPAPVETDAAPVVERPALRVVTDDDAAQDVTAVQVDGVTVAMTRHVDLTDDAQDDPTAPDVEHLSDEDAAALARMEEETTAGE